MANKSEPEPLAHIIFSMYASILFCCDIFSNTNTDRTLKPAAKNGKLKIKTFTNFLNNI